MRGTGIGVVALHVHHGLSAHADAWLAHCERECARRAAEGHALAFDSRRVDGRPQRGESVEAWAREARYAALADMARSRGVALVLLGHHRRDQAETVLLQALRGAGVAGLAAMPRSARRGGLTWARPWLGATPARIERYARVHGLDWVEDDSNADRSLRRNRLRHAVWPALEGGFADAEVALAAVAAHAAEALACADELAAIDLASVAATDGLRIDAWMRLSTARRGNVLRAWLHREAGRAASATLVARLLGELPAGAAPASWPAPADGTLRRYRGVLSWRSSGDAAATTARGSAGQYVVSPQQETPLRDGAVTGEEAACAADPGAAVDTARTRGARSVPGGRTGAAARAAASTNGGREKDATAAEVDRTGVGGRAGADAGLEGRADAGATQAQVAGAAVRADAGAAGEKVAGAGADPRRCQPPDATARADCEAPLSAGSAGGPGAAGSGSLRLPGWSGRLRWFPVAAGGLPADSLALLRLAPRAGGERFQIAPGRPPRSLKKQFQSLGVPAWQRGGPLVYVGDALAYVPGLGHDARTWAPPGSPQVGLTWEADAPAAAWAGEGGEGVPASDVSGSRAGDDRTGAGGG